MRSDYKKRFDRLGRWMLSAAVAVGYVFGRLITESDAIVALLFAFLSGGVVLNILKEELPEENESSFSAFAGGAVFYSLLLYFAGIRFSRLL